MDDVVKRVMPLAEEICDREGYKLYDIEFVKGQNILRIFIDKEVDGINHDDCANFSQGLNFLLDSEDPIPTTYNLEVSSPGLDRSLNHKWHFEAQVGKKIKVIIKARTETSQKLGMKRLEGLLEKVEESAFVLKVEEKDAVYVLPFSDVHKCNVIFEGF